jgi:serine/threonine protein kinase
MLPYIDPQHFKNDQYKSSKKSDVYSVGMLLWEISSGRQPFESFDKSAALKVEISNGKREAPVSDTPNGYNDIYKSIVCCNSFFTVYIYIF